MAITKKTFIDLETVINAEELNAWQDELIRLDAEKLDSLCAAAPYDATETYAVGDLCIKASALYRCSTAIETPEAWTAAHWTETTLAAELLAAAASAAAKYAPVITDTASGSVASIPDGADGLPLVSLVVQINPVQSGSGDPSPVNKRVISGWTGCDISHSGADTSNPDTITETWQAEAGTVYYATIDIVSGVLTVLGAIIDMGKLTYTETASGIRFDIIDGVGSGSQGTPAAFAMCSDY
ncbi:MAG: hypothetical protein Q4E45_02190, partial [Eubacteriales bacterium]|nr:hypothetical protein [Eubacteriales bacterium]